MSDPNLLPTPDTPDLPEDEAPEREPFLKRIRFKNFLSFGPDSGWIPLRNLNVLIGPNGSGKSNFIQAIEILRKGAARDLQGGLGPGGKAEDFPSKLAKNELFQIESVFHCAETDYDLGHRLELSCTGPTFTISDELLVIQMRHNTADLDDSPIFGMKVGTPPRVVMSATDPGNRTSRRAIENPSLVPGELYLAKRDRNFFPDVTYLGGNLADTRVYRFPELDTRQTFRRGQYPDALDDDFLAEDGSNFSRVLNNLAPHRDVLSKVKERIQEFLPSAENVYPIAKRGGAFELHLVEEGLVGPTLPARMSDGTIRYLMLLVILLHPDPPPLICIEEPEIGLHPDIVPEVGRLLRDASTRTQLIVTTHSDVLIDALSGVPETVVVCEKEDGITQMERLSLPELDAWLADYSLGHLWRKGTLGGNRW